MSRDRVCLCCDGVCHSSFVNIILAFCATIFAFGSIPCVLILGAPSETQLPLQTSAHSPTHLHALLARFRPIARRVVSGGTDGSVRFFDARSAECRAVVSAEAISSAIEAVKERDAPAAFLAAKPETAAGQKKGKAGGGGGGDKGEKRGGGISSTDIERGRTLEIAEVRRVPGHANQFLVCPRASALLLLAFQSGGGSGNGSSGNSGASIIRGFSCLSSGTVLSALRSSILMRSSSPSSSSTVASDVALSRMSLRERLELSSCAVDPTGRVLYGLTRHDATLFAFATAEGMQLDDGRALTERDTSRGTSVIGATRLVQAREA